MVRFVSSPGEPKFPSVKAKTFPSLGPEGPVFRVEVPAEERDHEYGEPGVEVT